jgi:putative endonuclease
MPATKQAVGEEGERIAEQWLRARGWVVLARRFRNGHRDVDLIVARDGEEGGEGRTVAFVEVKARGSSSFGGPLAAVGWQKQRELCRSARVWISRFQQAGDTYRFDVVGVVLGYGRVEVQHVENAFLLPTRA